MYKNIHFILIFALLSFTAFFIYSFINKTSLLKKKSIENPPIKSILKKQNKPVLTPEKEQIQIQLNEEAHLIRVEEPAVIQKEEQKNYNENFKQFYEEIEDISNEPITIQNMFRDQMRDNYGKTSTSIKKRN